MTDDGTVAIVVVVVILVIFVAIAIWYFRTKRRSEYGRSDYEESLRFAEAEVAKGESKSYINQVFQNQHF